MSDSAFLQAIRAYPEDDVPRLVYADWLEEQGNPIRAEFIRVQCELASTPEHEPRYRILEDREHELLSDYEPQFLGSSWPKNWQIGPSEWSWKRGFLDEVSINFGNLMNAGYLCDHPIRSLDISSDFGQPTELLERVELRPMLEGLNGIDFSGWSNLEHEGLKRFFNSDVMGMLCDVDFRGATDHFDVMEILRHCPNFLKRTKRLCTSGARYTHTINSPIPFQEVYDRNSIAISAEAAVYEMLREAPLSEFRQTHLEGIYPQFFYSFLARSTAHRLKTVDLTMNVRVHELPVSDGNYAIEELQLWVDDYTSDTASLLQLLYYPLCQQLERLVLGNCSFTLDETRILHNSGFSHRAKSFSLGEMRCFRNVWCDLFRHDCFQQLRHLVVEHSAITFEMWQCLTNHPFAGQLLTLTLGSSGYSFLAWESLRGSCEFQELRSLRACNLVNPEYFKRLMAFVKLDNLKLCNFYGSNLDDTAVTWLLENDRFRPNGLGLHGCNLSDDSVRSLINSPKLSRLNWLDLSNNISFTESALLALAESPYLSRICELSLIGCGISDRVRDAFQARLGPRFSG